MVDTYTLACVSKKESGLKKDIWLVGVHKSNVEPYVLIRNKRWKKVYLFRSRNRVSDDLSTWISENIVLLIRHWEGQLTDREVLEALT